MSVRLRLASLWMPRFLMAREVKRIRASTDATLDELITRHGSLPPKEDGSMDNSLEGRRAAMARGHERRVRALIEAMGQEEAVRVAREALFRTGVQLGEDARIRLGVRPTREDLVRAAGVMYRILGIEFSVVDTPEGGKMEVHRCALAREYSHMACLMLSAVDEGVVSGLNPKAGMRFQERLTGGFPRCVATISFKEGA